MRRNMSGNLGLYKYLWPGSVQKVFSLMHYTYMEIQKPSHSITEVRTMTDILVKLFKAELTDEQASNFFNKCCHEGRDVDDGGLGFE